MGEIWAAIAVVACCLTLCEILCDFTASDDFDDDPGRPEG